MRQFSDGPDRRRGRRVVVAAVVSGCLLLAGCGSGAATSPDVAGATTSTTAPTPTFSNPGLIDNRYLPLTRSTACVLKGHDVDGVKEKTVRTVLKRTKTFTVGGQVVPTVVVRDDAYAAGELVESTQDYFAQADDGTVYYFGEAVRNIQNGRVVNTNGTWLYGRNTDRLGVAMPPEPQLGQQWHVEDVPGVTTESDRVEETGVRTKVSRWGVRADVIRISEFIQPEGEVEWKLYASGIGVVAEYEPGAASFFAGCSSP